jgi:ABC-type phosphate/phosphonate transport system substrate-binding protein
MGILRKAKACALCAALCAAALPMASHALKIVIHDDSGAEGDRAIESSRYTALKQTLEKAIGRPVELLATRDRRRVGEMMERNLADVFIVQGTDVAAHAMVNLGYHFIVSGRPDVNVLFIAKTGPIENLKSLAGKTVAMPPAESLAGQMCAAELRDFLGTQFTARHSKEYSAVVWSVENGVEPVGCIASHAKAKGVLAAKKLNVIYEGRPVPATPVVASLTVRAADRVAIAKALSNLEEEGVGRESLRAVSLSGFSEGGETRIRTLGSWLKTK